MFSRDNFGESRLYEKRENIKRNKEKMFSDKIRKWNKSERKLGENK